MRKILSVLLCIAIIIPCTYVGVSAEENYTFYKIDIDAGTGAIGEKAIVKNGEIYIPATSFSNYTRFSFDTELKTFLIKGQDFKKAFKSVIIDIDKKRVSISGKKFFDLSDCLETDGELYLPLCQMLPVLNADIYEVKDNIIYISNNKLSLAEVLYDFDISDYYFNMSGEFYDSNSMTLLTIVPSFVWDSITNWRYNRLDIVYNSGEYNDYKDAFSAFLSDDNLYLKAMAEDASAIDSTVKFFNKANDTAKDMKSVYDWVETAGKSEISSEAGGVLLDLLKAYYDSGDLKTDDLKGLNDAWTGGKISFGDCIEILTYVYTYATQIEDNRQMLNAVYNVDSKISKKEADRKAAKQVYDLYGDNVIPALYKEVVTTVATDTIEDLSPIGVYKATAKVAGTVLETFMPFEPSEVAKLPIYSDIVLSALSKYRTFDTTTDESTENLRLSLLLCMISSKKCFEVMEDVFEKDGVSYYEEQIQDIEQLIMALYFVEENTDFDSFEHFEEYKEKNLKLIADSKLLENLEEFIVEEPLEETEIPEKSSIEPIVSKKNNDFNISVGIYTRVDIDGTLDEITVHSVTKNIVEFSIDWVRVNSIEHATVEIFDGSGNFTWTREVSGEYVSGHIEFTEDKTITLTIDSTTLYEIEPGIYKYEYYGTEEEARISYNQGVLLMNNDSLIWCSSFHWGPDNDNTTENFLCFNKDNTYVGWQYVELGLYSNETTKYEGQYVIEDGVLYLDENAYDLYAYTAGSTIMNLKASGTYDVDFSGDYELRSDEFYQFIVSNNQ